MKAVYRKSQQGGKGYFLRPARQLLHVFHPHSDEMSSTLGKPASPLQPNGTLQSYAVLIMLKTFPQAAQPSTVRSGCKGHTTLHFLYCFAHQLD